MRRSFMLVLIAFFAINAAPAMSAGHATQKTCDKAYNIRVIVKKKFGDRAPGRNICRYGIKHSTGRVSPATYEQKLRYKNQLARLIASAPPYMSINATPPAQEPGGTLTASAKANLPSCTWQPESGGDYNAVNSSSGAYGKYQIMPLHWSNPKTCKGLDRSPAGQERCAAIIWQKQGSGAWVNC